MGTENKASSTLRALASTADTPPPPSTRFRRLRSPMALSFPGSSPASLLDSMMGDFFAPSMHPMMGALSVPSMPSVQMIKVDVSEDDKTYTVSADLPGITKDELKVEVDHDVLCLSVDHSEEKEEDEESQGVKWHRVERRSSYASRRLRMPENANMDSVDASLKDGVLTLTVQKKQKKEAKKITVAHHT